MYNILDDIINIAKNEIDKFYNTKIKDLPIDSVFENESTYTMVKLHVCDELGIGEEEFLNLKYIEVIGVMTMIVYRAERHNKNESN